jgi:hypothetical protein
MTASNFIVHPEGDSTRETVLANVHARINELDGKQPWQVSIKRYRKPRTKDSNAYLWSGCYPLAVRELGYTAEEWHEEMCMRHFGKVEVQKPGASEWKPYRTTTTDENGERDVLPGLEFWKFVEFVRQQFALGGVYIPEPDPFWKEHREATV